MATRTLPPTRYVELYGPDVAREPAPLPPAVNADAVLALGSPIPLAWGEDVFTVAPISFLDGVALARFQLQLRALETEPPTTLEAIEELEREVSACIERMWRLLEPRPEVNPFANASPREVGELLPFFLTCQMLQGASGRSRMGPASRST